MKKIQIWLETTFFETIKDSVDELWLQTVKSVVQKQSVDLVYGMAISLTV